MKAVLISIHPKFCELIFNGKKTIEVRCSAPKLQTPFKVYVYMTKNKWIFKLLPFLKNRFAKVIGSFVCDRVDEFDSEWSEYAYACAPTDIPCAMPMSEENAIKICKEKGCMTLEDIIDYFGDEEWRAYFWHVTNLKIYDKPKELSEFYTLGNCEKYDFCNQCKNFHRGQGWLDGSYCDEDSCLDNTRIPVTRPPQSWCYVEELQ
mgnify:CR=1 FL=1